MIDPAQSDLVSSRDERGLRPSLDELCQNARLLIRLRWVAGSGILLGTLIARWILDIHVQPIPLIIIGLAVLCYNSLLFFVCRVGENSLRRAWTVAWGQIILDWSAMTALVHFTGGITSPALIYFVIHAALSGTVLLPWHARSLSGLAILIVAALAFLERGGVLPHIRINDLGLDDGLYKNTTYIFAVLFFFGTTTITLSELVADKAQRLRQREKHIQQLFEARSTFMRVATHELRAPVVAGLSLMHNIEQGYVGELTPQQAGLVHRVTERLDGLRILIDDLLTLAASREASIANAPLEPVSVRAVLQKIIDQEKPNAERKQISLQAQLSDSAGIVMAGDIGLAIIFGNLLNNAIKYTLDGGQVMVDYRINRVKQSVEVKVVDTGIGIPADDLPQIFSEFFRARNAKALQINGSGIGLSTVRTLIDRYRGTIEIQSEEGKGSTLIVTLPLAPRQSESH